MAVQRWVSRLLAHTRFVPTPVYRLMVLAWLSSGVLQLIYGAPASVRDTASAHWFDWAFVTCQLVAAALVFAGLYFIEENTTAEFVTNAQAARYAQRLRISLTLELVGIIGLQTIIAVQVVSSTYYQGRLPTAGTTWMAIIFALWLGVRQRDILQAQRTLT